MASEPGRRRAGRHCSSGGPGFTGNGYRAPAARPRGFGHSVPPPGCRARSGEACSGAVWPEQLLPAQARSQAAGTGQEGCDPGARQDDSALVLWQVQQMFGLPQSPGQGTSKDEFLQSDCTKVPYLIHASHTLVRTNGLWWCNVCGGTGHVVFRALGEECKAPRVHGKRCLRRLREGNLPPHLAAWPEERAGEALLVG